MSNPPDGAAPGAAAAVSDGHDALLEVAGLLAKTADAEQIFSAVTAQAATLSGASATSLLRVDGSIWTVLGRHRLPGAFGVLDDRTVGTRVDVGPGGDDLLEAVLRERQPVHGSGPAPDDLVRVGFPVVLGGRVWGVLEVVQDRPFTPPVEQALERFVALASGALGSAAATSELRALEDERAALRRMHQVAGNGGTGPEVLHAVVVEGAAQLGGSPLLLAQLTGKEVATVVAASDPRVPIGTLHPIGGESLVAQVLRQRATVRADDAPTALGVPVTINGRLWGAVVVTASSGPLPVWAEPRLTRFLSAVLPTIAAAQARAQIAEEQGALHRVAELVARGAPAADVFAAVPREASILAHGAGMCLTRFEGPRRLRVMGSFGEPTAEVGALIDFAPDTLPAWVFAGRRTVRVDDYRTERDAGLAVEYGIGASVAAAVLAAGSVWGMLTATSEAGPLPHGIEHRLERFTDLVAAALANGQARAELQALADEQAALRRVAELVAHDTALQELFPALTREASEILGGLPTALMRYEPDDSAVIVAVRDDRVPLGMRLPPYPGTPVGDVLRTGRPARVGNFDATPLGETARTLGVTEAVAVPIMVERRLWGVVSMSTLAGPLPADAEVRLAQFADLGGAAIANAENRAKLQASRARVVATADETRRRLQRDVHDGAQQRLVHTIISLKLARHAIATGADPDALVDEALAHAERATRDLRDVVRGILPASLTQGGLRAGLESLVADLVLPVDLQVRGPRCPERIELTAYFVVAEALTNVVKHAQAARAWVKVSQADGVLAVVVGDDGVGGADPARGSGLLGLLDRVDAASGSFTLASPAGGGTRLTVWLPLVSTPLNRAG